MTDDRGSVEDSAEPRFLIVGRVLRPHGIQGELKVELHTDDVDRFGELDVIYFDEEGHSSQRVEAFRPHKGAVLLKLAKVNTRNDAESLRNKWLYVGIEDAVPLEEDEYYLYQLPGLKVFEEDGEYLGVLEKIIETGANNVFVVELNGRQLLLPDTSEVIADIDFEQKRMLVRLIPGLRP